MVLRTASKPDKLPMLHVRLNPELLKMVSYLAIDWDTTRSGAAERLLREALEKYDARQERNALMHAVH